MDIWVFFVGAVLFAGLVAIFTGIGGNKNEHSKQPQRYYYSKKDSVMTQAEWSFYDRLSRIAQGKYYVFPQIHLSSLMQNQTKGKYYKLAYQRINRRSVDFVLCDIETRKPVYAVELDDVSHDSEKRQARDNVVNDMLDQVNISLVRFRDVETTSDEEIISKFRHAAENSTLS